MRITINSSLNHLFNLNNSALFWSVPVFWTIFNVKIYSKILLGPLLIYDRFCKPYVAVSTTPNDRIFYIAGSGNNWSQLELEPGTINGANRSIVIFSEDHPHIISRHRWPQ
jgi:hypothetical protein